MLHDWCNKDCSRCYPVCGMVHIKDPLLLKRKSSPCSGSTRFPLSLSEWSFIICHITINKNVLSVSLNKTFLPSFLLHKLLNHNNTNKEGRNDALNTFYLRLYGVRHMVKDHSNSEKGNPLPPIRLLFPISSKGSFICIIPQTG